MPENSANSNTTSINMGSNQVEQEGTIGTRKFKDSTANILSESISRNNYREKVASDKRLQEFRKAVYNLVSTWLLEDKLFILAQYNDTRYLKSNDEEEVNRLLTESLIIHLDPADLQQLCNDVLVKNSQVKKSIDTIQKKGITTLSIKTFDDRFAAVKEARSTRNFNSARAFDDPDFGIPKSVSKQYGNLRKELQDVLHNCFDIVELSGIAFSMGIEIPDGTAKKDLYTWIINKTLLYVELLVGKNNKISNLSNAIMDPEPYNKLLQYTSYSYLTGKPGLDPHAWIQLKNNAREAKKAILERAKMQRSKASTKSKAFSELSGLRGSSASVKRSLKVRDTGVLKDATLDQLIELAGKYGINPNILKGKNEAALKLALYRAMAADNQRTSKLIADSKKSKTFLQRRNAQDLVRAHTGYSNESILGSRDNLSTDLSESGTPILHLKKDGSIAESIISMAVPVYLVGQSGAGLIKATGKKRQTENYSSDMSDDTFGEATFTDKNGLVQDLNITEDDKRLVRYIMTLPEFSPNPSPKGFPNGLDVLRDKMLIMGADEKLLAQLDQLVEVRAGSGFTKNMAYAWAYASISKRSNLEKYLKQRFNIPLKSIGSFRSGLKKFISNMSSDFGRIFSPKQTIKETAELFKKITSYEELPEKDRALYDELIKLTLDRLQVIAGKFGYNQTAIMNFLSATFDKENKDNDIQIKKYALISIIAIAKGCNKCSRYCEYKIGDVSKNELYKAMKKRGNIFKKMASVFRRIGNALTKKKSKDDVIDPESVSNEESPDTTKNSGQRLPIPKIELKQDLSPAGKIIEAVPVYVVNGLASEIKKLMEGSASAGDAATGIISQSKNINALLGSTINVSGSAQIGGQFNNNSGNTLSGQSVQRNIFAPTTTNTGLGASEEPDADDDSLGLTEKKLNSASNEKKITRLSQKSALPVFAVNQALGEQGDDENSISSILTKIVDNTNRTVISVNGVSTVLSDKFTDLMMGLGSPNVLTAPMGVGQMSNPTLLGMAVKSKVSNVVNKVGETIADAAKTTVGMNTGGKVLKAATGATITSKSSQSKYATSVITGDAAGNNIFKGGARPELVQSTGDLAIKPLNKESTASRQKIQRMSSTERQSALATGITSHVVKFSYKLPSDVSEVSNQGEAIKVFDVKPGLTDIIKVAGAETTIAELIAGLSAQLATLNSIAATGNGLLSNIASKQTVSVSNSGGYSSGNPFAGGFPDNLDEITGGN